MTPNFHSKFGHCDRFTTAQMKVAYALCISNLGSATIYRVRTIKRCPFLDINYGKSTEANLLKIGTIQARLLPDIHAKFQVCNTLNNRENWSFVNLVKTAFSAVSKNGKCQNCNLAN